MAASDIFSSDELYIYIYLNYPPHDLANLMIRCLLIIYEVVGKFFHQNFDKSSIFELVNEKGKMTQKK